VADMFILFGRYGLLVWPMWFVADMVQTPLTPVLMKLNGSPRLRLYNEKSDVIRPILQFDTSQ